MKVTIKLTRPENLAHYGVKKGDKVSLDFEREYLPLCIASEVYEGNTRTPMEAKKAQAIAARTYVAAHALAGSIIDDTAKYQAFSWKEPSSIPNSMQAAHETEGQVLMCDGVLITAWYSNANGGRTKRSDEAWSSYKRWTIAQDDPWDVAARNKWGQVKPSHSVGMSQMGAAYAASIGISYDRILAFYYPNTVLVQNYGQGDTMKEPENGESLPIQAYPITVDMHTKNDCYKAARIRTKTHVIVHSTAVRGPAYIPRWQKWNRANFKKCAHAFIDWNGIYQNLPWEYQGWLNGKSSGNDCSIAFEICEPLAPNDTPAMAADLYGKTLFLCTTLCKQYGIPPENVICHAEAYKLGLANNHADVNHWWGKKNTAWEPYTMAKLREDVAAALGIKDQGAYPYQAKVQTKSSPLNIWSNPQKGRSLAQVKKGDTLHVLAHGGVAGWFRVEKDGVKGYADGQYLIRLSPPPSGIENTVNDRGEEQPPEWASNTGAMMKYNVRLDGVPLAVAESIAALYPGTIVEASTE